MNVSTRNQTQNYNYKCPDCHGEFNYPERVSEDHGTAGITTKLVCPFCKREMAGI